MTTNPNDKEIKLEFVLDIADITAWNNYYLEKVSVKKRVYKGARGIGFIFSSLALILGIILIIMGNDPATTGDDTVFTGIFAAAFGLFGLLYFFFSRKLIFFMLKGRIKKNNNLSMGAHKFLISEAGITDVADFYNSTIKWTAIQEIAQTDTHFFLIIPPNKAIIIPKRAFTSTGQAERFIEDVNKMLQETKTRA
jgi:hypothetical protein